MQDYKISLITGILIGIFATLIGILIYQKYFYIRTIKFNFNNKNYDISEDNIRKAIKLEKVNDFDTLIEIYNDIEFINSNLDNLLGPCNLSLYSEFIAPSPSRNIEIEDAQTLISNYQAILDSKIPRSVYFSLEHIIKKIDSLKSNAFFSRLNATYENFGLRAYFGRYGINCEPYNCNDRDLGIECADKNTVFLELTFDSILIDNNRSTANYNPRGDGRNITDISDTFNLGIKNTLRNVGGLCPPNCPEDYVKHDQVLYPH
ncbi:MAG: hypothetical protein ABI851_12810 [Saprospiraceae bacterium]